MDYLVTDTDTCLNIVIDLLQPDKGTRSSCLILTENIRNHKKVAFSPRHFFLQFIVRVQKSVVALKFNRKKSDNL